MISRDYEIPLCGSSCHLGSRLLDLARMTQTPVLELLASIHDIAQTPLTGEDRRLLAQRLVAQSAVSLPWSPTPAPPWIDRKVAQVIDLLESDARLDADPMPPISRALKQVDPGEVIVVKHQLLSKMPRHC